MDEYEDIFADEKHKEKKRSLIPAPTPDGRMTNKPPIVPERLKPQISGEVSTPFYDVFFPIGQPIELTRLTMTALTKLNEKKRGSLYFFGEMTEKLSADLINTVQSVSSQIKVFVICLTALTCPGFLEELRIQFAEQIVFFDIFYSIFSFHSSEFLLGKNPQMISITSFITFVYTTFHFRVGVRRE